MTTSGDKHLDGGVFEPAKVTIRRKVENLLFLFKVDGLRCSECGEELISRDTALELENREQQSLAFGQKWERDSGEVYWTFSTPSIVLIPSGVSTENESAQSLTRTESTHTVTI